MSSCVEQHENRLARFSAQHGFLRLSPSVFSAVGIFANGGDAGSQSTVEVGLNRSFALSALLAASVSMACSANNSPGGQPFASGSAGSGAVAGQAPVTAGKHRSGLARPPLDPTV